MPEGVPEYPLRVERRVFVPMDDGTRIALTVYLPDTVNDGPFPTIVESLPYRKDDAFYSADWPTYAYLAQRGFAGARIDIRGTGASTGIIEDEYVPREQDDTLAVLEWLAEQDWCSGNLGMWGVSWGGFSSLQTAMLRPPELKAIAPVHATHDRFACDVHYTGGSLHAQEQVDWPPSMVVSNALPPDPDIVGDRWFEEWMDRLEGTPQWPGIWLRHQKRDDYWLHGSPCADYASIQCPTLLIGGWVDGYVDGMLALAEHLTCEKRTVVGPWGHYRPATGSPGPTLDHLDLLARWFGHHLRGDDNGVMDLPALTAYIRTGTPFDGPTQAPFNTPTPGYWRAESAWPPPDTAVTEFTLSDLEHDDLVWSGPQWVGLHAPAWDRAGIGSSDSHDDDAHSVTFETAPFEEPFEILGTPEVEVTVASSEEVGMVAARLLAIAPDGRGHLVTRGNRNLVFPHDLSDPVLPVPDRPVTVRFPLMATSAVLEAGWRLRLALAGADFPVVWPPGQKVMLSFEPTRSRLLVPTVPVRHPSSTVSIPMSPPPPTPPGLENEGRDHTRVIRGDSDVTYERHRYSKEGQRERANLTYTSDETWTISVADDDPASTRVRSDAAVTMERPGWKVATRGTLQLAADADEFHLSIELTALHEDRVVFSRTWKEVIPREWA
ncbi:MAG: CocE/NonD family hydrolase [Acidimicrobiia bacterium]